jgi:hypothetical protein
MKVGTNRATEIAHMVIKPTETGRNMLEGVVILHETISKLHMTKIDGVLFKIAFEKAYHMV